MSWLIATFRRAIFCEGNSTLKNTQTKSVVWVFAWVEEHAILALLIHL